MRKLSLESLQVESFVTTDAAAAGRGTVRAHGDPLPSPPTLTNDTYDAQLCGETQYFDCSYGCSMNTECAQTCGLTEVDCV